MELMAVMLIIGILFGIIFTGASYLFSAQEEKKLKLKLRQYLLLSSNLGLRTRTIH